MWSWNPDLWKSSKCEPSLQHWGLGDCALYPALSEGRALRVMGVQIDTANDRHVSSSYYQPDFSKFQVQTPVAFTPTCAVVFIAPILHLRENRKRKVKSLKMPAWYRLEISIRQESFHRSVGTSLIPLWEELKVSSPYLTLQTKDSKF